MSSHGTTLNRPEDRPVRLGDFPYKLRPVVSGASDLSTSVNPNAELLCDGPMESGDRLSVLKQHEQPAGSVDGHVPAAPSLIQDWLLSWREFVGDLSQTGKAFLALGLPGDTNTPVLTG
jgi:circadian clock protein KaiB